MLLCTTLSRCSCFHYKHRGVLHLKNGTTSESIEDLSLLCGAIHWDQIYRVIVVWSLDLMEDECRQLRQHMKFNLPGTTKTLLETPIDTGDQMIRMVTKWDGTQVTSQLKMPWKGNVTWVETRKPYTLLRTCWSFQ
jgi:hypothetical protein